MKLNVIKDREGNVIAAVAAGATTPEGDAVHIRPAHDEHSLHSVEVPDEFAALPAEHLGHRLKEHLDAQ